MGRPIKKKLFGSHDGAIKVSFKTGGTVYTNGWIAKQKNPHLFVITNGTQTATCQLVAVASASLVDGQCCIAVTDDGSATHYVKKLSAHVCVIDTGAIMPWTFTVSTTDGKEQVAAQAGLAITQPSNATISHLASGTFAVTATATDSPITYQWQSSTDGGVTWGNVAGSVYSGMTTATLTLTNPDVGKNGFKYRCVVSDADSSITSNAATLTVS